MTDRNASYRELNKADIARYGVKPDFYVRTFHYLHRRASSCNFLPFKIVYKILFRLWANRRGLEISANKLMGGEFYMGHAYNITINPHAVIGSNCNIHKGVVIGQTNRGIKKGVPTIGNCVWIGINAAIVGGIKIGDDVLIGTRSLFRMS